mgnify:CR=1 FL=1
MRAIVTFLLSFVRARNNEIYVIHCTSLSKFLDVSGAKRVLNANHEQHQAPVVQTVDNAIQRINHYPLDIAIGFATTYPVDSDLSGG